MQRLIYAVPKNILTVFSLCFIAFGAALRVRRRRSPWRILQLVGGIVIVAAMVVSLWARTALVPADAGLAVDESRIALAESIWRLATVFTTIGFLCFAFGYVWEEEERNPAPGQE
jgi:hypothetical protein